MKHFLELTKPKNSNNSHQKKAKNVLGMFFLDKNYSFFLLFLNVSALFDRIDSDHNGTISKIELQNWIKSVQTRYLTDDVERQWKKMNNDSNNHISWDEYDRVIYHTLCKMTSALKINPLEYLSFVFLLDDDIPEPKPIVEQLLRLQKKDRRRYELINFQNEKEKFLFSFIKISKS